MVKSRPVRVHRKAAALEEGKWYAVVADSEGRVVVADTIEEALAILKELIEREREGESG
jgi:predicted RNase H-like HicB family nuclease